MSMTELLVYLILVTVIGFAFIMALYSLQKKTRHNHELNQKTKAEK